MSIFADLRLNDLPIWLKLAQEILLRETAARARPMGPPRKYAEGDFIFTLPVVRIDP